MSERVPYAAPHLEPPYRVLLRAAATAGWYDAPADVRSSMILPRFARWLSRWEEQGARLLASFDDDLFMAGEPDGGFSIYLCYELDALELVPAMLQEVREEADGARLDRWLRFDARVGRPLFLAGDAA